MNKIIIAGTQSTPAIHGDASAGVLSMSGDSYPENSFELFGQVFDWLGAYLRDSQRPLAVELGLLYLNTSSIKAMMEVFDTLQDAYQDGREVTVSWRYGAGNERVAELAEEFREDYTFPFEIVCCD